MQYTGGDINRLGERIAQGPNYQLTNNDLDLLQSHRLSFTTPLFETFKILTQIKSSVQRTAIIAFRLKRITTIINKVIRKPRMQLNRMWDIAGIRIIFDTEPQLRRALEDIGKHYHIRGKIRDYFDVPKKIGYKAIHLYITEPNSGKVIEVQLRTKDSHNWATLVEITDVLYKTRLKEKGYDAHPTLGRFHSLVSNEKNLNDEEANFLYQTLDKFNFISKLADTFRKNSYVVKKQWQEVGHRDKFFLIESSAESSPILKSYRDYQQAEKDYFEKYKEDEGALIVLTSIHKPSFDQISIAYANYILSYHKFIKDVQEIIKNLALDKLENQKYYQFRKIFRLYEEIQANNLVNILIERDDVLVKIRGKKLYLNSRNKLSSKKRKEIRKSINNGINHLIQKHTLFIDKVNKQVPKNTLKALKTKHFLKRHEKRVNNKLNAIDLEFED